jgi:hypothetical protein
LTLPLVAQTPNTTASATTAAQVPRLVRFTGTVKGAVVDTTANGIVLGRGVAPTNVVAITFSLYAEQSGGVPLWSEVQNVRVDAAGHYTIQLGSTKADGLPVELFSAAQAQWLGVQLQGQAEQPRVMLVSVPYALKAADAETFGGKPPSAYMQTADSDGSSSSGGVGSTQKIKNDHPLTLSGSGTTDYVPLWTNASTLASSVIYQSPGHDIGIGTVSPEFPLDVQAPVTAISGASTESVGANIGVQGKSAGNEGIGVEGLATDTTGSNIGVQGQSASNDGIGVEGLATAASAGVTYGVHGVSDSPEGYGVIGDATSEAGSNYGVAGNSNSSGGIGVVGNAISETGETYGIYGTAVSPTGIGVGGAANSLTGFAVGVYGTSDSTSGVGVVGSATAETGERAFGVKGVTFSTEAVGVFGLANTDAGANIGVQGSAESPDAGAVAGYSTGTTGSSFGVVSNTLSTEGVSLYAVAVAASNTQTSIRPIGILGSTNQTAGVGIAGTTDDGWAVGGANYSAWRATARFQNQYDDNPSAPAFRAEGTFYNGYCYIDVSGNLTCSGNITGNQTLDGGQRTVSLYAVQAAENWNEDAGSARLANGSAVVQLESTFAQTINGAAEYHVFLTPEGDCKGLYVTNKTPNSFEVRELGGGKASIGFDYRIMAHRRGRENVRLADQTERLAMMAAVEKPVLRKPLKLPGNLHPSAGAVPKPRRTPRMMRPVPHQPPAYSGAKKVASQKHN